MDTKETAVPEDNLLSNNTAQKTLETISISRPLFLFEHVTALVSGLIAVGLLSLTGYTLLDYWLSENNTVNYFSGYLYGFYLYLLCGLLFFAALHFWAHWRSERKLSTNVAQPIDRTAHAFLAVFLVILTVAVVSNIVAVVYIALNAALGTADYSTKGLWSALLGPLQAGLWAGLLCWYFKGTGKGRSTMIYLVSASVLSLVAAGLLLAFPIMAKRDTVIDSRTSSDLNSISFAINDFVGDNNKLPNELSELKLDDKVKARLDTYEYEKTNTSTKIENVEPTAISEDANSAISDLFRAPSQQFSYKLCADFKTDTSKDSDRSPIPFLATSSDFGAHPAGKHCFDKVAYGKNIIDDQPASSGSSGSSLERY